MNYAGKWLLLALACSPAVAAGNPFIGKWKETSIMLSTSSTWATRLRSVAEQAARIAIPAGIANLCLKKQPAILALTAVPGQAPASHSFPNSGSS